MGTILDFVPNHVGVGGASNPHWLDVLRHGAASRYADWFDIDWRPPRPGMDGKVLVPFLGKSYADALADGDICLKADDDGFAVWAYEREKLPIRPEDFSALLTQYGDAKAVLAAHRDIELLHQLILQQNWRLAHFATAADEINYRRFFINSELAGIRIDRPHVFEHAHALIFSLIAEGLVDGLRIDHVDGLVDPLSYLQTLRTKLPRPTYLTIEKILAPHECLRAEWPVEGTTGYEVGADLTRLLTPAIAERSLTETYDAFVGPTEPPRDEVHRCKLRIMDNELSVELHNLARETAGLARSVAGTSDLTEPTLRRAWREVIVQLEVYRTYIDGRGVGPRDRRELALALARARRSQPQIQPATFDFIQALLCGVLSDAYDVGRATAIVSHFQQYTGPVMAKGVEDTALYRYNRLVSLNEVGAHPDRFNLSIQAFHDQNVRRLQRHPHCLIGTSTHDTKRGEDIRLMISAIADDPERWAEAVFNWRPMIDGKVEAIHRNDLYLYFQLLLGGWPIAGQTADFGDRLKGAMTKSLREARQRSDWGVNDLQYEAKVGRLIDYLLADADFLASFHSVRSVFEPIGRRKALIHLALKLTIPGVPDIYRGAEDWEQSFVDPDNRRPLDFEDLKRRLAHPDGARDDKLAMTQQLLKLRKVYPRLFAEGSYEPMELGPDYLGFRRCHAGAVVTLIADMTRQHSSGVHKFSGAGELVAGFGDGPVGVFISAE
jgi:(1->4)-alpha-D-glucan 1-alpha-D-glucosylmutase